MAKLFAANDADVLNKRRGNLTDCNNIEYKTGIRFYYYGTSSDNAPSDIAGALLCIAIGTNYIFQIAINDSKREIFIREFHNTWSAWKQIYGQTLLTGTQLATTIADMTQTNVASIANVPAGTYLVHGKIIYSANATGVRDIGIVTSATTGTMDDTRSATSNGVTTMSSTLFLTLSSSGTIYLHGYQNSGSTLDLSGIVLQAYKLY